MNVANLNLNHVAVATVLIIVFYFLLTWKFSASAKPGPKPVQSRSEDPFKRSFETIYAAIQSCYTLEQLMLVEKRADDFFHHYYRKVERDSLLSMYGQLCSEIVTQRTAINKKLFIV